MPAPIAVGDTLVAGDGDARRPRAPPRRDRAPGGRPVPAPLGGGQRRRSVCPGARASAARVAECLELVGLSEYETRRPAPALGRPAAARRAGARAGAAPVADPARRAVLRPRRGDASAGARRRGRRPAGRRRDGRRRHPRPRRGPADGRPGRGADRRPGRSRPPIPATLYRSPASPEVAAFIGAGEVVRGERIGRCRAHRRRGVRRSTRPAGLPTARSTWSSGPSRCSSTRRPTRASWTSTSGSCPGPTPAAAGRDAAVRPPPRPRAPTTSAAIRKAPSSTEVRGRRPGAWRSG